MPHDRLRQSFLNFCVVAALASGLAGCDIVVSTMEGGGREKAQKQWTQTYTLTGADARFEVVNVNGSITAEVSDGPSVEVSATIETRGGTLDEAKAALEKVEIREEAGGSQVRLESTYPKELGRKGVTVTYKLRVPRSVRVALESVNGTIHLNGVQAVKAETTNGNIEGRALAGEGTAGSTNGSIKLELTSLGVDGLTAETTNGTIDVKLPQDVKATLAARCVNGGIAVSDLPFERTGEGSRRKLDGTINGGGPSVRLNTTNGSIRVSRTQ